MVKKLLFWIDVGVLHLGIAKIIQEKINAEFYAIYDLNHHLKKSFSKQNIIKFDKEWFFWDYVLKSNQTPDIEYLAAFEKKYKINLWQLAYGERIFQEFNSFYNFSNKEILGIFEMECKFFEKILDEVNPDCLLIKMTDFHRNHLLATLCKAKGIQVLMLFPTKLGYRAAISSDQYVMELARTNTDTNENQTSKKDIEEYMKNRFKQTKKMASGGVDYPIIKKILPSINWLTKTFDKEYRKTYDHYGVTRTRVILEQISLFFKSKLRKRFIDKNCVKVINTETKFIYFPLQVQPERNVDVDAPYFSNQIEVITNVAKSLPVGYKLFVKEHYNMRFRNWRKISDYKKILQMPNVVFLHPSINPNEVLSKCSMVITVSGTAGLEAVFNEKPSIVFGNVIYETLSSVQKITNLDELPKAIKLGLIKKIDREEIINFVKQLKNNSFEFDVFEFHNKVINKFHYGGFIANDKISMEELNQFFEDNRNELEIVSAEYVKKINLPD